MTSGSILELVILVDRFVAGRACPLFAFHSFRQARMRTHLWQSCQFGNDRPVSHKLVWIVNAHRLTLTRVLSRAPRTTTRGGYGGLYDSAQLGKMAVLYRLPNLRAENFHSAPRACASTSSAVRIVALRQNLFSISRWIIVFGGKLEQRAWHAIVHYRSTIVHLSLVYECLNP